KSYILDRIDNQSSIHTDKSNFATSKDTASAQLLTYETPIDIRLINEQGQFLGLGAVSLNGRLQPKKLIQR
ncbi:tRNA pseudouridine(55) synthase TruB, partial [Psychrobacter sp. 1U2]